MTRCTWRRVVILAWSAIAATVSGPASAQTPIGVSYQPALYWSVPYFIATEKGWWQQIGLKPTFTTFPAGAPQIAAAPSKSWDVGGTGSAPAVLGAARFNILTIGITNDESAANVVMARAEEADAILKAPASLKGKQLLLSTNSTGEYAALACLRKWGLQPADLQMVNLQQAQIISAFSSGNGTLAGVWAPNDYTIEDRLGGKIVCSGKDAGVAVPGTLVVRADFAKSNPDEVARYLAVYLRSVAWQRKNPKETIDLMRRFYQQGGVTIPDQYLKQEIDTRPTFTLDEQLKIMARNGGLSMVDTWYQKLGEYLKSTGTVSDPPDPKTYITDEFMKRVAADPKLRAFANDE
jgi:ABC-type nitrate/sulfonate/bicarbonate transport system substrate-binding protein